MSDEKNHNLNERIQKLHEKYCRQLPGKYTEIETSWNEYQADLTNPTSIETFYRLIHTLKGTAATFGFTTQSDICFEIQKLLLNAKENHTALTEDEIKQIQKHINELKANINTPAEHLPE